MVLQGNKAGLSNPKEPDFVWGLTSEVKDSLGLHINLGVGSIAALNEFVSQSHLYAAALSVVNFYPPLFSF